MADTFALLPLLKRWWWALILGAVLAGAVSYFVSSHASPTYRGEAKFIVGPINADVDELGASGSLARTYSELATGRPVLEYAINRVGADTTVRKLQENLTATANDISRILTIDVRNKDAKVAAGLANAIGRRLQELSTLDSGQNAKRAAAFVGGAEIKSLTKDEGDRLMAATAKLLGESPAGRISVVQAAEPEGPADRGTLFLVILAMVAGAVVAAILALLRDSTVDAFRNDAALEELSGVKHLGGVDAPRGRGWRQSLPAWTAPGTAAAEKYRLLAFKTGFLETREPLGSLVLLDPKEGHTSAVVAGNLAAAISQAGLRVLVVDANTSGGGLTRMFRLEGARGYTDLLAEPDDTALDGHVEQLFLGGDKPLHVLPLGTSPTAATVDVDRMRRLLERLRTIADVVLVSAPPPHRVPAGLIWARVADGTLLTLDIRRTSRDEVADTLRSLAVADAHLIGTTLAQRRPLAEFLRRLRGASTVPPRVEPFVIEPELDDEAISASTDTVGVAPAMTAGSTAPPPPAAPAGSPDAATLEAQHGTTFRQGTIRFRAPEAAPPENPPPWSPPAREQRFRLRRRRRKPPDRDVS
ncbi:MAG: tyrosine-protein kinase [Solirubrobacteraceae bacterium]|nr:tyrosine-protein kinase [Solirubrobacteraceae bacterium]